MTHETAPRTVAPDLQALLYELLDAHGDTMTIGADLSADPAWAAHLDYLRTLQRVGSEMLAHAEDPA